MKLFSYYKTSSGIVIWFNRVTCNNKTTHTKSISIGNYRKSWKLVGNEPRVVFHENGGRRKLGSSCFDCTLIIGYLIINYTNWQLQPCKSRG